MAARKFASSLAVLGLTEYIDTDAAENDRWRRLGPLAGRIPAICRTEAGSLTTPKKKATRTSQKVHRQRPNTPTTNKAMSANCAIGNDASIARLSPPTWRKVCE